jgi:phosphatidylserine/phosphatidylglycerophosphate/cardiolipin synthase-like enzyme
MSIDQTKNIEVPLFNISTIPLPQDNKTISPNIKFSDHAQIMNKSENTSEFSKIQLNFSKSNPKLNQTKSIFLESEFPTENNTIIENKYYTKFDSISSESGLKFLLWQAMKSIKFKFLQEIQLIDRYKETMNLQGLLGKKVGYETNVEDIELDNEEFHRDAIKVTEHDKPDIIQQNFSFREGFENMLIPKEIKQRKNSHNSDDANKLFSSMMAFKPKKSKVKKVQWKLETKSIKSNGAQSDNMSMESLGESLESEDSNDSQKTVYKNIIKIKNNLIHHSSRSLKSFSRIIGIYRNRKSLNILTHKKIEDIKDSLWEFEVSCTCYSVKVQSNRNELNKSELVQRQVKWKIRRTKRDFQNLFKEMKKLKIITKSEFSSNMETKEDFTNLLEIVKQKKINFRKMNIFHSFIGLSILNLQENQPNKIFQFAANLNISESAHSFWRKKICGEFWVRRWMFINDYGFGIMNTNKLYSKVSLFYYFSNRFRFSIRKKKVKLRFENCFLEIQFASELMVLEFIRVIYQKLIRSQLTICNRFLSFSNQTKKNNAEVFLNGNDYFRNLHKTLQNCDSSLDIIGWGISPFIFLLRPVIISKISNLNYINSSLKKKLKRLSAKSRKTPEFSRLDIMLLFLAKRNVKIRIILYHESVVGLGIDSELVKDYLESLSDNITVVLVKQHFLSYWVVHEKVVIVDNSTAYIGGIDLINGRYDNEKYSLFDSEESSKRYFPGNDFSNVYQDKKRFAFDSIIQKKNSFHRMPFRDIQTKLQGQVVEDVSRHFAQVWQNSFDESRYHESKYINSYKNRIFSQNIKLLAAKIKNKEIAKDLYSSSPFSLFEKNKKKRIQEEENLFQSKLQNSELSPNQHMLKKFLCSRPNSVYPISKMINRQNKHPKGTLKCQLFRSSSYWNLGYSKKATERSVYYKIIDLILTSQKFLYMENQFFVSNYMEEKKFKNKNISLKDFYFTKNDENLTKTTRARVHNRIIEALFQRIKKAHEAKQSFICCLVLNLMPDFFGDISNKTDKFRIVMDVTLNSLYQGKYGLIPRLIKEQIPWNKYLKIFGLKNHGKDREGVPQCESIYVHSKIIIQDDHEMLIGSANLNDRSLVGTRDSELVVSIIDDRKITGKLEGKSYLKSKKVVEFRKHLMRSLLGNDFKYELDDFMDKSIWKEINQRVRNNTRFYLEVFGHFVDNEVHNLDDIKK